MKPRHSHSHSHSSSRLAGLLLVAWPALAWAHSPVPGMGKFYSGMLHPVLAPAALIALVALGLLIGQRGLANARMPVLAFLVAVALGGVAGSQLGLQLGSETGSQTGMQTGSQTGPQTGMQTGMQTGSQTDRETGLQAPGLKVDTGLLALGLLVAACVLTAWQPPPAALLSLAGGVGALAGLGLSDMAVGEGRWVVLSGTWLGAAFLALGVAAVAELALQSWQQIGLRVVASWLAASALLVLGLQWAGPLPKGGQAKASSVTAPVPAPAPAPAIE
jgi:urease accessory protein